MLQPGNSAWRGPSALRTVELEEVNSSEEIALSSGSAAMPVLMSPIDIEQAVINVIRNAIQAGAGLVVVGLGVANESTVEITISDDGPGLGKLGEQEIFEPFFTTHPDSGSGLGLTVAREIIESRSGRLYLTRSGAGGTVSKWSCPSRRQRSNRFVRKAERACETKLDSGVHSLNPWPEPLYADQPDG